MAVRNPPQQSEPEAVGTSRDPAQLDIPVDERPQWMHHLWKEGVTFSKAVAAPRPHPLEQFPPEVAQPVLRRVLGWFRRAK